MYIFYVIYFYSFLYYISSSAFLDLIWFSFYQSVSSVTQSCPTLWPHGQQHSRLPCTSPTPRAYSISCPSSQWCHPTILSSVIPFSCVQSFPALGSFPVSQFFTGEGNGTPLQYSCLENPTDGGVLLSNLILFFEYPSIRSDQIRSVAQSCPTLCDPINRSTPGLPVHHQLPEFTQTHVHRVSDAIQPSHPLPSPSPPAPNPSQHQSLFQWVNSLHEVAKVLEFQL